MFHELALLTSSGILFQKQKSLPGEPARSQHRRDEAARHAGEMPVPGPLSPPKRLWCVVLQSYLSPCLCCFKKELRTPMPSLRDRCCSSSDDRLLNEEVEESVLRGKLDLPTRLALLREQAGIEKRVKRYFDPRSVSQPHYHTQLR